MSRNGRRRVGIFEAMWRLATACVAVLPNLLLFGLPTFVVLEALLTEEVRCLEELSGCTSDALQVPDSPAPDPASPPEVEQAPAAERLQEPIQPPKGPKRLILPSASSPAWWGTFAPMRPVWLPSPTGPDIQLLENFTFTDHDGLEWEAPRGFISDGASIPQPFWSFAGGPLDGPYRFASIIHDYFCCHQSRPWRDVHMVFYQGLRATPVEELKARTMWSAVRYFGPRWEVVEGGKAECEPAELPTVDAGDIAWFRNYLNWLEGPGTEELDYLAAACDAVATGNFEGGYSELTRSSRLLNGETAAKFLESVGCPSGDATGLLAYLLVRTGTS